MKKKNENLITWKLKYSCEGDFSAFLRQYNSLLRFTYNRLLENAKLKTSEINSIQKTLNNCELMNSWFRGCAEYQARGIISSSEGNHIIFGGKNLFIQRCQNKISREEFIKSKLLPLFSIGEANAKGNRFFNIVDLETIKFKPSKNSNFVLHVIVTGKKRKAEFAKLINAQDQCLIPITYKLDNQFVYLTFDYNILKTYTYEVKQNRVIAVDLNPNSIGWSIVDWTQNSSYDVVQSGTFSLKLLNDYRNSKHVSSTDPIHKYVTNKRDHEVVEIAKRLFSICRHFHCETFVIEDLNIVSQDNKKGRRFNRLVNNQWNRNLFINQIKKRIKASSTTFIEVQPQWSSYIGNLLFRKEALPDECLASIEIGRRGWEFSTQYIYKRRLRTKTVIYPDLELVKNWLSISLEEIGVGVSSLDDWITILLAVKKSGAKYRFSTSEAQKKHSESLFSKFYKRRYQIIYEYL